LLRRACASAVCDVVEKPNSEALNQEIVAGARFEETDQRVLPEP